MRKEYDDDRSAFSRLADCRSASPDTQWQAARAMRLRKANVRIGQKRRFDLALVTSGLPR